MDSIRRNLVFLYTYEGALKAVPEGWRLPTDDDWKKLEATLGMSVSQIGMLDEWRGKLRWGIY